MLSEQTAKPGAPFWATEIGQAHGTGCYQYCVDMTSFASILLNNAIDTYFLDQFGSYLNPVPSQRQFIYELLDEQCGQGYDFGLLDCHGNPHLGGIAFKNLLRILSDSGPSFTPANFSFGFQGGFAADKYHNGTYARLTQKSNGDWQIILQTDQSTYDTNSGNYIGCTNYQVQMAFGTTPTTVRVYDPMHGAGPFNVYSNVSAVALNSCQDPLIVEVSTPTVGACSQSFDLSQSCNSQYLGFM